jgi:hypothetical protein
MTNVSDRQMMANECPLPWQHEENVLPIFTAQSQLDWNNSSQGRNDCVVPAIFYRIGMT